MEAETPGGHFVERHGAQTTLEQQWDRAVTGKLPNGQTHTQGGVPLRPSDASRFYSNRVQLRAMQQAQKFAQLTGETVIDVIMPEVVGEGFLKHGVEMVSTTNARVIFRAGKPYTAFPYLRDLGPLAFEGAS